MDVHDDPRWWTKPNYDLDKAARIVIAQHPNHIPQLKQRITVEVKGLNHARSVGWDRELVITDLLVGISGWLGREVFEQSFDDGSMKRMALEYERMGKILNMGLC